ncbi:hypothetical protein BKI52_14395 [marine bacterium AO1-C]|nr:hypothetical protein BKI52_14395 [marine bacterium AO1-C]
MTSHKSPLKLPVIHLKKHQIFTIALGVIIFLGLTKDLLHAYLKGYSFYFSESILFNVLWVLYIPYTALQAHQLKKVKRHHIGFLFLSAFLCYALHLLSFTSIVFLFSKAFFSQAYSFASSFSYALPESLILSCVIYLTNGFLHINRRQDIQAPPSKEYITSLSVTNHGHTELIHTEHILYVLSKTPYISIITPSKTHIYNSSLRALLAKVDPSIFIQIHKTSIINIKQVTSCKSRKNGDYDVQMSNGDIVRLSRNYSTSFKKLFFT